MSKSIHVDKPGSFKLSSADQNFSLRGLYVHVKADGDKPFKIENIGHKGSRWKHEGKEHSHPGSDVLLITRDGKKTFGDWIYISLTRPKSATPKKPATVAKVRKARTLKRKNVSKKAA